MRRVEVVVRFAGDLYEVVQVLPGTTFRVGTTAVVARAGTDITVGLVTVTMTAAPAELPVIPRERTERRPYLYGAASLVSHLALVAAAVLSATSEPLSAPAIESSGDQPGGTRIKRFSVPAQTTERVAEPPPIEPPVTADQTPEETVERDTPTPRLEEPLPSEMTGGGLDNGPTDGDGTSRFDPAANPAFDTIKVGDYSTVSTGLAAGDHYGSHARNSSLVVITCDRSSCLVLGGEKATRIRKAVEERMAELTDCYKQAAESGGGSVEIDFGVNADGKVQDLGVSEADPAGFCVAKILRSMQIDEAAG
jgi:hypothetical protein